MLNQIHKILAVNELGTVNQLLQKQDPRLGVNEGIGKYSYITSESTTPKPYTQSQEIVIPLTNANVDIVEFHRSFFTLNLDLMLNFNCDTTKISPVIVSGSAIYDDMRTLSQKCDLFFIGFKNATDCIDSYRLQQNGVDIGSTMQNRASIESFLYNQMKPQTEKGNKHGSYSLWSDVVKGDESVCGIYVTYEELSKLTEANKRLRIQFPVTIGFDMLLPLQGFNLFPNSIFGDLSLVVKVNPNALVWACTDANLYIKDRVKMTVATVSEGSINSCEQGWNSGIHGELSTDYFDHRFTQVRVDGLARSNIYNAAAGETNVFYKALPLRIEPDTIITNDAVSTIMGFSLKDSVKQALATYYTSVPFVIPSERIFIQSFSTSPTISGLNCAMTLPLNNAKEVIALFPRNANEVTVFRNPEYDHLMITMLNRNFPQKGANTNSTEFYRIELESCNLDTILPPTESFENSYLKKVCPLPPYRQRCNEDDTDFLMLFNLERQSSNAFFSDPVNSAQETIMLTGSPQVQGLNGDPYFYLNAENNVDVSGIYNNKACPILCIVSDTFWMFSTGVRANYEIALSWNECLAKYYPDVLRRLAGQ